MQILHLEPETLRVHPVPHSLYFDSFPGDSGTQLLGAPAFNCQRSWGQLLFIVSLGAVSWSLQR